MTDQQGAVRWLRAIRALLAAGYGITRDPAGFIRILPKEIR